MKLWDIIEDIDPNTVKNIKRTIDANKGLLAKKAAGKLKPGSPEDLKADNLTKQAQLYSSLSSVSKEVEKEQVTNTKQAESDVAKTAAGKLEAQKQATAPNGIAGAAIRALQKKQVDPTVSGATNKIGQKGTK
jgi:hypothetical protein